MAKAGVYLNFNRNAEQAFNFYKSVFGGEFADGGIARYGDFPNMEGMPPLAEADKNCIMHIALILPGNFRLMGADILENMGINIKFGNNAYITLDPDSKAEAKKIFDGLSAGGTIEQPLEEMFWGAYYGTCIDKFGIYWMINCTAKQ